MSSKGSNPMGDHEYLRSAVVQKLHTEDAYDVLISADITLQPKRAVMVVRLAAYEYSEGKPLTKVCGYEFEWPNAYRVSWCGALFNAYVKLDQLVEESTADAEKLLVFKQR